MLPISRTFFLTHDDHLPHNNFASVARRCSDRLQIGMSDFLRRNPQNGGKLEVAQQMAGHESARTTGLYDRRNDAVALDEIERVVF